MDHPARVAGRSCRCAAGLTPQLRVLLPQQRRLLVLRGQLAYHHQPAKPNQARQADETGDS